MTALSSLFATAVREAPAPADDAPEPASFTGPCDTCQRETRHRLIAVVRRQQVYQCDGCDGTSVYDMGEMR